MQPRTPERSGECHRITASALLHEAAMDYEISCVCGNVLPVTEALAGSSVPCAVCARDVPVPPRSEFPAHVDPTDQPYGFTVCLPSYDPPPTPDPLEELVAAERAVLRGGPGGAAVLVMATLTSDAVWVQEAWRLRSIPLRDVRVQSRRGGRELALTLGAEPSSEELTLAFSSAAKGTCWQEE